MAPLILQIFVSEKMDLLAAKLVAMLILGLGSLSTGSSIIMISFHHLPSIIIIHRHHHTYIIIHGHA